MNFGIQWIMEIRKLAFFAPEFVATPEFVAPEYVADADQKTSNYLVPEFVAPLFVANQTRKLVLFLDL